jgi:hypothetical protein
MKSGPIRRSYTKAKSVSGSSSPRSTPRWSTSQTAARRGTRYSATYVSASAGSWTRSATSPLVTRRLSGEFISEIWWRWTAISSARNEPRSRTGIASRLECTRAATASAAFDGQRR